MSIITAIISGLPFLGKLLDRFFPDKKGERAEMRRVIAGSKEFKWFMRIALFLVVYEVVLKTLGWMFPQLGLPESIISDLEFFKWAAGFFTGLGG